MTEEDLRTKTYKKPLDARGARIVMPLGLAKALLLGKFLKNVDPPATPKEAEAPSLSREEHFAPFGKGVAEWQYIAFQYEAAYGSREGITISLSELTNPLTQLKTQQMLVMKHNLGNKETSKSINDGHLKFDNLTNTYEFTDMNGNVLAKYSYRKQDDDYTLTVKTGVFNTNEIDPDGLVLKPMGDLMPVSGDGNFIVASYPAGFFETNYYADNVSVIGKKNGDFVGWGRRDSENLEKVGAVSSNPDIDHTWVHTSLSLENEMTAFVTAWQSKTGGNFRFCDISIFDPDGIKVTSQSFNEEEGFQLDFTPTPDELETVPGTNRKISHGGTVTASTPEGTLFSLTIDGDAGQIIDSKGFSAMVEAHGTASGKVLDMNVIASNNAIWETTDEKTKMLYLPRLDK